MWIGQIGSGHSRRSWQPLASVCVVCLLVACKGTITSPQPLITPENASYPVPAMAEVEAQTLNDDNVWERREGRAHLSLADGAYVLTAPDDTAPSPDRYLFKAIKDDVFIVQASNGKDWAYGLIVHDDMYYLFAFNRADQNCTTLSPAELGRVHTKIEDDGCSVTSVKDLEALLLYLRQRFPYPTSAFIVRQGADR